MNIIKHAMKVALEEAKLSKDPYRKVGAVILDSFNKIHYKGHNRAPEHLENDESFWQDKEGRKPYIIHAEIDALSKGLILKTDRLIVTLKPCIQCILTCAAFGIKEVYYLEEKEGQEITNKIAENYGIKLYKVEL